MDASKKPQPGSHCTGPNPLGFAWAVATFQNHKMLLKNSLAEGATGKELVQGTVASRRPPVHQAGTTAGCGLELFKKRTILFRFCAVAASRNCSAINRIRRSLSLLSRIRCLSSENNASTLLRSDSERTNAGESTRARTRSRAVSYQLTPSFLALPLVHLDFSGHGPHCVGVEQ